MNCSCFGASTQRQKKGVDLVHQDTAGWCIIESWILADQLCSQQTEISSCLMNLSQLYIAFSVNPYILPLQLVDLHVAFCFIMMVVALCSCKSLQYTFSLSLSSYLIIPQTAVITVLMHKCTQDYLVVFSLLFYLSLSEYMPLSEYL